MEKLKNAVIYLAIFIVGWHVKEAFNANTKLTGIFKVAPKPGYLWTDNLNNEHYFWQNIHAYWTPGTPNPSYNIVASENEGKWSPLPGYKFDNEIKNDYSTSWDSGQMHPIFKAVAAETEGQWTPNMGYRFQTSNDGDSTTVWSPGLEVINNHMVASDTEGYFIPTLGFKYDSQTSPKFGEVHWVSGIEYSKLHLISNEQENSFSAAPGYRFLENETKSLAVIWSPGLINSANASLKAGEIEGEWVTNDNPYTAIEPTPLERFLRAGISEGMARLTEWVSDSENNIVAKSFREQRDREAIEGIKGIIK